MTTLSIDSLTTGTREGSGSFDVLMRSVKAHLENEYSQGRITGDQYTSAYVAAIQLAMQEAVQYQLSYPVTNQQIELLEQQVALATEQVTAQRTQNQILEEQLTLAQRNITQADSQIALLNQQLINAQSENQLIQQNITRAEAETSILEQRRLTEEAQTKDTVGGSPVAGLIGRQASLFENQAEGYIRDAEQKAAKMMVDIQATRITTGEDTLDLTLSGMQNEQIREAIQTLMRGAGITVLPNAPAPTPDP